VELKSKILRKSQSLKEEAQAFEKTGGALSEENKILLDRLAEVDSEVSTAMLRQQSDAHRGNSKT
jgi:hypothetical protein